MTPPEARFCPYCGQKLRREPIEGRAVPASELKPACAGCGYIHHDAPTPIAGAVIVRDGEVLLARPHHSPEFALVTGFPEPYERIEDAAVREAQEEVGFDIRIERVLGTYSCEPVGQNQVLVACLATSVGGDFHIQEEELAEGRWFPLDGLPDWPATWPLHDVFEAYRSFAES